MVKLTSYLENLRAEVAEVDVQTAFEKLQAGALLVDVRESDEVKSGSPKNAIRIPKGMLEVKIGDVASAADQEVYVLCASGKRSLIAAHNLQQMGFTNVRSVRGGFTEWKNQALPFELPLYLKEADVERYKRHLLIPEVGSAGQLKLLNSRVLVVGAGGIGSPVAWYLTAAGVGHIGIVDNDIVDQTNLQRQILHTEDSVGTAKVDSAKKRLSALNSRITIKTYNERLSADNVESILSNYDLVLDGTDNFTTRYLINDACVKLGIPNVHGSVYRFEGQVSTFWPAHDSHAPCYRCLYESPPPADLSQSCAEVGVLGVIPGIVGVICATEAIKLLIGAGDTLVGRLLSIDALNWDFTTYTIQRNQSCRHCNCQAPELYPAYSEYNVYCAV